MKTKEEIEILRADALAGDAGAQNDLGCAYSTGDGVVKNLKEAFLWFERSAKQGNKYGQYNVGRYYQHGWGTIKNIQFAIEWYEKSADQDFWKASNMLGEIYEKGYMPKMVELQLKRDVSKGIPANPDEAFYWYSRGQYVDEQSKYNLARCYEEGIGTAISLYKACMLYKECKGEEAKRRLEKIRESYNPVLDTRLKSVDIIGNNPFRVLGVWSNSPERDIRANQSKLEVMAKVGKYFSFDSDGVIPCNIFDNIAVLRNGINYHLQKAGDHIDQSNISLTTALINGHIKYEKEVEASIAEWEKVEQTDPSWAVLPSRNLENIESSINKLASDRERIKFALFWFCNYTQSDEKALRLLSEKKRDEAWDIWNNSKNFSADINRAVLAWIDRKDIAAISNTLKVIHDDKSRSEFVNAVTSGRIQLSEEELSHMFWDSLYDFPETELSLQDILKYGSGKGSILLKHFVNDKEKEYNKNKVFDVLKSPIDDLLLIAEKQDENDFEKSRVAYNKIIKDTPNTLLKIKRSVGEDFYRYKLLCNEIAGKLLEFAIHYNNDKKDDWAAPQTALYMATSALNIAVDDNLRERCKKNVEIFRQNKQISSTEKLIEEIDKKFKEIDGKSVNLSQAEKLQTDIWMYVECLKTENGKESNIYKNVSDRAVNAILNVIIAICNRDKDVTTASTASSLIKKLKSMQMSSETRTRLEKNLSIISHHMMTAISNGDYGGLIGDAVNRGTKNKLNSHTETKEEKSKRRIHKVLATIMAVLLFSAMWYYISWNNNLQYFMERMAWWGYTCIGFMVIVALFVIIMWGLEFQEDPYDTDFVWIEKAYDGLMKIANEITMAGASDGKTYSWPFAIPFQILALAIGFIGFPVRWLAKLAALIK